MKIKVAIMICCSIFFLSSNCDKSPVEQTKIIRLPDNSEKVTIKQGVWGNVWFHEGDFMPTVPPPSHPKGIIKPVVREIYVYSATTHKMISPRYANSFYKEIHSDSIAVVTSDNSGFYQVELDTGLYSFFVKEDSMFYANSSCCGGLIQSKEVFVDSVSKLQIDITYRASY